MAIQNRSSFGHMPDGTPVEELTLRNRSLVCKLLTYGGAVRALAVPDRSGRPVDVVLGYDRLEDYLVHSGHLGALIGRYGNRIGGSRFTLNGKEYLLAANNGPNHLHGGLIGFDRQVWSVDALTEDAAALSLFSPDGQEGYPGDLTLRVTYVLREDGLEIDYQAESGADTLCNPTNHTYFNLSGHNSGPVTGQYIQIMAGSYTPTAAGSIPTGEIAPVEGTPMDLRVPRTIGARIDEPFEQLTMAGGYDHNWVIDGWNGELRPAAWSWSPDTGICMETLTTLPGVQFYSGNGLKSSPAGKGGAVYGPRHAFCLETQYFPDSPHHPNFPSTVLAAGKRYHSRTVYRFGTAEGPDHGRTKGE